MCGGREEKMEISFGLEMEGAANQEKFSHPLPEMPAACLSHPDLRPRCLKTLSREKRLGITADLD